MSGGSMDYCYCKMGEAADCIQGEIALIEKRLRAGVTAEEIVGNVNSYYTERHPDVPYLASPKALLKETLKHMRHALKVIRQASIYAERVEWLTSGDDGYESFCLRTNEELAKCKERGGVE